jgi:hypothetical protein
VASLCTVALAADKPDLIKPIDPNAPKVQHPPSSIPFKKIVLTDKFQSEGVAIGDFNHDGKPDVVYGPYWYEGPDFNPEKRHQIYAPKDYDPNGYSDNFVTFAYDINGDGWDDVLVIDTPGKPCRWYENPKGSQGDWPMHPAFDVVDNESPQFTDITGDGKPELICSKDGFFGYAQPDAKDPTQPWVFHKISPKGKWQRYTHGLGVGDVNGDGRADLIMHEGWFEHPASLEGDPVWKFHPVDFGPGGAHMYAYDVNGDGRADIITSLEAHGYGLAWFEQKADGSFDKHLIMGSTPADNPQGVVFTQPHAIELVDIDGDGLKDIVVGKRWWAHAPPKGKDPEVNAPAVLYWFKLARSSNGEVKWIANEIDNNSGVGTEFTTGDLNGDKHPDIVIGNKKGAFVFIQAP